MSEPTEDAGPRYFLRRIHIGQWNSEKRRVSKGAFFEDSPEKGLSLFREDLQTPRGTIQHAIDNAKSLSASDDPTERERGQKQLAKNGETVDEWLERGWRVAKVPIEAFTERNYTFDEPDATGHLNAFGDHALNAMALAELAECVLPEPSED